MAFSWVIAKNQPVCESKTGIFPIRETNSMNLFLSLKKLLKYATSKYYSVRTATCTGHWHVHIISLLKLCIVLYYRHFTVESVNLSLNWDARHKNERKLDWSLPRSVQKYCALQTLIKFPVKIFVHSICKGTRKQKAYWELNHCHILRYSTSNLMENFWTSLRNFWKGFPL